MYIIVEQLLDYRTYLEHAINTYYVHTVSLQHELRFTLQRNPASAGQVSISQRGITTRRQAYLTTHKCTLSHKQPFECNRVRILSHKAGISEYNSDNDVATLGARARPSVQDGHCCSQDSPPPLSLRRTSPSLSIEH